MAYQRIAPTDRWHRMGPVLRSVFVELLELERPQPRPPRRRPAALRVPAHVPQRQRGPAQNRFSAGSTPAMRTARPPARDPQEQPTVTAATRVPPHLPQLRETITGHRCLCGAGPFARLQELQKHADAERLLGDARRRPQKTSPPQGRGERRNQR